MKIHLYTVCWNEEVILPYFLDYYSKFCEKIIMFDNESTDKSIDIIKSYPNTEIRSWSHNNQFDDVKHIELKNHYKESRGKADWVIVTDTDEFLYHPNLLKKLQQYKSQGITLPKTKGYDMLPERFPEPGEDLIKSFPNGCRCPHLDKQIIFNPELEMNFSAGCHFVNAKNAKMSPTADIRMLHYKKLSIDYVISRHKDLGDRLCENNKKMKWGLHYYKSREEVEKEFAEMNRKKEKAI